MARLGGTLITIVLVLIAIAVFGYVLYTNAQPAPLLVAVVPMQASPTAEGSCWSCLLEEGFGSNSTPLPTVAIQQYATPTLALAQSDLSGPVAPEALGGVAPTFTPFAGAVTPTLPPTATPTDANAETTEDRFAVTVQSVAGVPTRRPPSEWSPPPLIPPLSRDPLGRDHYFFARPVDSNALTTAGLFYYPFGSDGSNDDLIVHHGMDIPNPIGERVRAGGSGTVIFASSAEAPIFQNTPSYGNIVVIEHDFGYRGLPLYTIYAHLQAPLVLTGDYVEAGEVIGLLGNTGRVSGPHVHFEVRIGKLDGSLPRYGDAYNPVLWMVPYVGHGVIAGRVVDGQGNFLQDADVTLRNWGTGLIEDTTTTYVFNEGGSDVNPDPEWNENFAFGDIPVGRYEVVATINGVRVAEIVQVLEGQTTFVELKPENPVTAVPTATSAGDDAG